MADKEEKRLIKNTIEEERLQVRSVVRRLGSKLSGLMFTCGILVLTLGWYLLLVPQDPMLSVRVEIIFTGALGFTALLNILCGLLLLLGED